MANTHGRSYMGAGEGPTLLAENVIPCKFGFGLPY